MNKEKKSLPLANALDEFIARAPAYFCTPGHRFEKGISPELAVRFGEEVFKRDLTETYGLDDLHRACGAIKEAEELAARLYNAQHTRFLVNGTTCANEAMIMAAAGEKDEILIARNSHSSCISGLILSGARPVWMLPDIDRKWGIYTGFLVEDIKHQLDKNKNIKAVMLVSPTYYGDLCNIKEIADLCHERKIPLLVDEAHGAHLYFSEILPTGALMNGADAVGMSTHKTLGSMTQSSMLHVNSELVDIDKIDSALRLLMSSSPSYILMTSLDAAREQMQRCGMELAEKAAKLGERLRNDLKKIPGVSVYDGCKMGLNDPTRVVFSLKALGVSGYEISERLFYEHNVCLEMADVSNIVAIVTFANDENDIDRLVKAVSAVADDIRGDRKIAEKMNYSEIANFIKSMKISDMKLTPREVYFAKWEWARLSEARGRISAESIAPYPPGIPVINPGEVFDADVCAILRYCCENNISVHADGRESIEYVRVLR